MVDLQETVSRVYRLGPASITVFMIVATVAYSPWASYRDSWIVVPILVCWGIAIFWHLLLIATEQEKPNMVLYTLVHLPVMFVVTLFCVHVLSGDTL
jgi:hypothetical protein